VSKQKSQMRCMWQGRNVKHQKSVTLWPIMYCLWRRIWLEIYSSPMPTFVSVFVVCLSCTTLTVNTVPWTLLFWAENCRTNLGYVHIDTTASPSTRIRVPVNTSLHVFQRRPFTLMQVLYGLPVNFTRTSSFHAGRVFIQPLWSEQHKILY